MPEGASETLLHTWFHAASKRTVMSTAAERAAQLDLVARLKSAYPELPDAPTPDLLDHARIKAYLKPVHDVGGEPDAPMKYENKQYEAWEELTYVICEVLAWRGMPSSVSDMSRSRRTCGSLSASCLSCGLISSALVSVMSSAKGMALAT